MVAQDLVRQARRVHETLNGRSSAPSSVRAMAPVTLRLPPSRVPDISLGTALSMRRSRYDLGGAMDASELAVLLASSVGLGRRVSAYGRDDHPLSVAPTAGGLRSIEAYVVVRDVAAVPSGVHRYDLDAHGLGQVHEGVVTDELARTLGQPEFAERAAAFIMLTGRLDVAFAKYPLRHYRTLHVDAGIAVQNLYLATTALGLSGCAVAGYDDAAIEELLSLDSATVVLICFAVGRPRQARR